MKDPKDLRYVRRWLLFFMASLVLSGLTAVPLESGTRWLAEVVVTWGEPWTGWSAYAAEAVEHVAGTYPFLFYGTDWLAFAHVVIALAFLGPYADPMRNRWVIIWGLWSCVLVLPLAFLWAPIRGIPFFWRCVAASFGILGAVPLWLVHRRIDRASAGTDENPVLSHA